MLATSLSAHVTCEQVSRNARPVRGTVRLLRPVGPTLADAGEVLINGKAYLVGRFPGGFRLGTYDAKKGEASQYDVCDGFVSCTCPDATFRCRMCKHMKALAALASREQL